MFLGTSLGNMVISKNDQRFINSVTEKRKLLIHPIRAPISEMFFIRRDRRNTYAAQPLKQSPHMPEELAPLKFYL